MTPGSSKGFTLVELMIVIALLVILSVIAVPGFNTLVRDNRIQSQAEEFNALLQYARSEAVIRKVPVRVTIDTSAGNVEVSARGDTLRTTTLTLGGVDFLTSATQLDYRPNGTATVPDFRSTFCRDGDTSTGFLLTVSGSGSTTLHHKGQNATGGSLGSCTP